MFRTTLTSRSARLAIVALGLSLLAASPAMAKEDKLTGLTPGHTVGGYVYPKGGGDRIPLPDATVADDGTATFQKPYVEIDRIEYFDWDTGNRVAGLGTTSDEDAHAYLDIGNQYALFGNGGDPIWTEHFLDLYDQSADVEVGDVYEFVTGVPVDPYLGGVFVWDDVTPFTGSREVTGFNIVIPEPASLSLLALGGLVTLRRRRVQQA